MLSKKITDLKVSKELKQTCLKHKIFTIDQLYCYSASELQNEFEFTVHMIMELLELQKTYKLGNLLRE